MKKILNTHSCLPLVGAFNGLTAKLLAKRGFKACYVSGGAISASAGVPDIGLLSYEHFCRIIKEVSSSGLPVFADADTGFGEISMLHKVVVEFAHAGASALHIEDQVWPKKCGHLPGKHVIKTSEMVEKIKTACRAREMHNLDMLICARTDAYDIDGLTGVIERSFAYIESGADILFPEGLKSEEEFKIIGEKFYGKAFLLANMTEFGVSPLMSLKRLESLGYSIALFPVSTLRASMFAVDRLVQQIAQEGTQKDMIEVMQSRKDLYELLDYSHEEDWLY